MPPPSSSGSHLLEQSSLAAQLLRTPPPSSFQVERKPATMQQDFWFRSFGSWLVDASKKPIVPADVVDSSLLVEAVRQNAFAYELWRHALLHAPDFVTNGKLIATDVASLSETWKWREVDEDPKDLVGHELANLQELRLSLSAAGGVGGTAASDEEHFSLLVGPKFRDFFEQTRQDDARASDPTQIKKLCTVVWGLMTGQKLRSELAPTSEWHALFGEHISKQVVTKLNDQDYLDRHKLAALSIEMVSDEPFAGPPGGDKFIHYSVVKVSDIQKIFLFDCFPAGAAHLGGKMSRETFRDLLALRSPADLRDGLTREVVTAERMRPARFFSAEDDLHRPGGRGGGELLAPLPWDTTDTLDLALPEIDTGCTTQEIFVRLIKQGKKEFKNKLSPEQMAIVHLGGWAHVGLVEEQQFGHTHAISSCREVFSVLRLVSVLPLVD